MPDVTATLEKVKVLIMDSSNNAVDLIKDIFSDLGFTNVIVANDGFQGVQIMKDEPIHLIFTDRELKVIWNIKNSKIVSDSKNGGYTAPEWCSFYPEAAEFPFFSQSVGSRHYDD